MAGSEADMRRMKVNERQVRLFERAGSAAISQSEERELFLVENGSLARLSSDGDVFSKGYEVWLIRVESPAGPRGGDHRNPVATTFF